MLPVRLIHPVFRPEALLLRGIPFSIQLRTEQLRVCGVHPLFRSFGKWWEQTRENSDCKAVFLAIAAWQAE